MKRDEKSPSKCHQFRWGNLGAEYNTEFGGKGTPNVTSPFVIIMSFGLKIQSLVSNVL